MQRQRIQSTQWSLSHSADCEPDRESATLSSRSYRAFAFFLIVSAADYNPNKAVGLDRQTRFLSDEGTLVASQWLSC